MSIRVSQMLLTQFHRTFRTGGFWDKNEIEYFKFCGQKVKVQGHGGVQRAGKCTFWPYLATKWTGGSKKQYTLEKNKSLN